MRKAGNNMDDKKRLKIKIKTSKIFSEIGVTPNLKGYDYAMRSIEILQKERIFPCNLWNIISEEFNASASSISRSIGNAFNKIDREKLDELEIASKNVRLTSTNILYAIAEKIRRNIIEEELKENENE